MLRDQVSPFPVGSVSTLAFVFVLAAGGCAEEPTSVDVAALGLTIDAVLINNGALNTKSQAVTLTITTASGQRPLRMCVSNTATCTFEPFVSPKRWLLEPGDGAKTVSVTLLSLGGVQTALQATVQLDTQVPVAGALTAIGSDGRVSLSWDPATDAVSGIQLYRLMMTATITPTMPTSCNNGQLIYQGTNTSFEHITVRNGVNYGYRVCPVDLAGNIGVGTTAQARPAPEYDPPAGSVTINAGALLTRTHSVTLDVPATDASTVASVCISQTATCTNWVVWNATKAWELRGPDGLITVNVWFRDNFGNASAPVSAAITLDTLPPTKSVLTTLTRSDGVAVDWTAATDVNGVASYSLVWVLGQTAPASCTSGTVAYTGTDLTYLDTAGPPGFRTYRLCATDEAGNINTGVVKTAFQLSTTLLSITSSSEESTLASHDALARAAAFGASEHLSRHAIIPREPPTWTIGLSRAELLDALHLQIVERVGRVGGRSYAWDVVSDAIDDDTLQLRAGIHATLGVIGLAQLYKWVEEADPNAELYYRDYVTEKSNPKLDAVQGLIRALVAEGARIDGQRIGSQEETTVADRKAE
jgi:hypothetical protein